LLEQARRPPAPTVPQSRPRGRQTERSMGCCTSGAAWERREEMKRAARKSGAKPNKAVEPNPDWTPPPVVEELDETAQMKLLLGQVPCMRAQEVLIAMATLVIIDVRLACFKRLEELQQEGALDELLPLGCVEAVIQAMEVHYGAGSAALQESGVRFLRAVASTPAGQSKVTSAGGCKAVIQAMDMTGSLQIKSMQIAACGALSNLASNKTSNKTKVAALGGVTATLKAMSAFMDDARVQQAACACLRMLTPDQANQTRIAKAGGAERILEAMKQHPGDAEMLNEACWALCHLAYGHPENQKKMSSLGVCQALLACMREHASSPGVQAHAMWGLKNMCASSQENQVTVAEGDCINLIRIALDRHAEEQSVVEQVMWLLRNLVDKNADNTAKFRAVVGENIIKELMQKHSAESNVQNAGNALQAVLHDKGIVNRSSLISMGSM